MSAVAYIVLTAWMGRQVLSSLGSSIAADAGDPLLNAAILAWNAIAVPWSEAWYQFPIYYPAAHALTFSEHLLGLSIISTPLYWLTGSGLAAYNLTLLLTYPLCGMAMYALVWRLTRSAPAAFLSGLAFAFMPYRAAHLGHIQVLAVFWAPLALLGLHGFVQAGPPSTGPAPPYGESSVWAAFRGAITSRTRLRWLVLFGASWILQGAANGYFLVYFSVIIGLWVVWFVVARSGWRNALMIAAAAVVALLPLAPILLRYVEAHAWYGFTRGLHEVTLFSADITAPLCPVTPLTFWGWLGGACGPEGELFIGPTLVALCGAGAWVALRQKAPSGEDPRFRRLTIVSVVLAVAALPFIAGGIAYLVNGGRWEWSLGPWNMTGSSVRKPFTIAAILLVAALASSRLLRDAIRRSSPEAFYLLAAAIAWVLTWGPEPRLARVLALYEGPFAWLRLLPGVDGLRVPARFWMMTILCLSVFMGLVVARMLKGRSPRFALALVTLAACGLVIDGWMPIPAVNVAALPPAPDILRGKVVLRLPIGPVDSGAEFQAITGGWSSVNGASGYEPAPYMRLRTASGEADPILLSSLVTRHDLYVVVDERAAALVELVARQPDSEEIARGNGLRQYRLRQQGGVPATDGRKLTMASLTASCSPERLELARDDDPTTRWECGAQNKDEEVVVDLGTIAVPQTVVVGLGEFRGDYPRRLLVETSIDGTTWQAAWDRPGEPLVIDAEMRDPRRVPLAMSFTPRRARYVRLRQIGRDDKWHWSIAELEIWSGPP